VRWSLMISRRFATARPYAALFGLMLIMLPGGAATAASKKELAREKIERAIRCDGVLNAYTREREPTYQIYRMKASGEVVLAHSQGTRPQDPAVAARLVMFVLITGLADDAKVSELGYERAFSNGQSMVPTPKDPAALPEVEQCVQLTRDFALADPYANNAAMQFGLYPAEAPASQ
jgi:hypothetical protein